MIFFFKYTWTCLSLEFTKIPKRTSIHSKIKFTSVFPTITSTVPLRLFLSDITLQEVTSFWWEGNSTNIYKQGLTLAASENLGSWLASLPYQKSNAFWLEHLSDFDRRCSRFTITCAIKVPREQNETSRRGQVLQLLKIFILDRWRCIIKQYIKSVSVAHKNICVFDKYYI